MNATAPTATTHAPQVLDRARSLAEPLLRPSIGKLHPAMATMVGYHMGWCDAEGKPVEGNGGKGVCLALGVLSAEAAGAPAETGLPGAVATELIHVASHMHDDIMDVDERRRGRTSLWKAFGIGPAILAGDAAYIVAVQLLLRRGGAQGPAAIGHLLDSCAQLAQGEISDLDFEKRPLTGAGAVDLDEYLAMAGGKTGAMYAGALGIGAILADAPEATSRALTKAGHHLGLLAQIVDDINGIWGDPAVTGKPVYSDIRSRKKSLPIIAAVHAGAPESARLAALLAAPATADEDPQAIGDLVAEAGGLVAARSQAQRQHELALASLDGIAVPDAAGAEIAELADFIRSRHA